MPKDSFDLIVIGSGPGGYVAAIKAAQLGLKVACVEKDKVVGGTCLNVGCIPSKALLQSSEYYHWMQHQAKQHGIECSSLQVNFAQMMKRKEEIIRGFNTGIAGLFKKNKVTFLQGFATFVDPHTLEVVSSKKETFEAKHFIIATGSTPSSLPFLPFDETHILSSTGALALQKIPKKMIVIGAGIIGVELGSVYSRLGSEVVFLEFLDRICPTLDMAVSKTLQKILEKQGLRFLLQTKVTEGKKEGSTVVIQAEIQGKKETFTADHVLVAIGRSPYTSGLGLERIGIQCTSKGLIPIDQNFRTQHPHILAIGDVVDGPMLAHKAEEEGIVAAELIAGHTASLQYMTIPSVVYTTPEVGAVGLSEEAAKARGLSIKVAQFSLKANSRARCIGEDEGFVKIVAKADTLQIVGIHILAPHAGELIAEGVLAMQHKLTAYDIATTSHAHPTLSEAIKEAALMLVSKAIHM